MYILKLGSKGPLVRLLQSVLLNLGYNIGTIDGVFGVQTQNSVLEYQRDNGLPVDGVVDQNTWTSLEKFILGYVSYTIKPKDSLFNIASTFLTNVNAILVANPGLDPMNLTVGQSIIVPLNSNVVLTNIYYTYDIMEMNIRSLKTRYPFIETGIIGQSVLGKNLYYIKLGKGKTEVSYNASHHGLEWITSLLTMKFIEDFSRAYATQSNLFGYDIKEIWENYSIYIVPMVNPDGVNLVLNGLDTNNPYYDKLLQLNNTGLPFSKVWQANIRGIDLNRNYPASWQLAKNQEAMFGITGPGPTRYGGPYPLSEPETQAMVNFTSSHDFKLVIAYHSQGEVIFWLYKNITPPNAQKIGETFSKLSGYALEKAPVTSLFAGYKDWFIEVYNKPGYTIEVGLGENPLPISQFDKIYKDNREIMIIAPTLINKIEDDD
ncbi:MAG: peptidoglycan-binding protein [Clostridiales bacterium]|nr:peptidoglycan-binding protein [Clostridiales bacterium]